MFVYNVGIPLKIQTAWLKVENMAQTTLRLFLVSFHTPSSAPDAPQSKNEPNNRM